MLYFLQAEDGIRVGHVTGVQTCALPILDYDALAERIVMINGKPFATMVKYLKETTLTEANADDTESEMIAQLIKDYKQLIDEIRHKGMDYAAELGDEPTMDILTDFQSKLEKHVWMLAAYQTTDR